MFVLNTLLEMLGTNRMDRVIDSFELYAITTILNCSIGSVVNDLTSHQCDTVQILISACKVVCGVFFLDTPDSFHTKTVGMP